MSCLIFDRWALYPPGKVPLGVTVHVNEEDGDVSIETPSSLQVLQSCNLSDLHILFLGLSNYCHQDANFIVSIC